MTYISRDPFARQELHRYRVYIDRGCDWCDGIKTTASGRRYLFEYTTETDGGSRHHHKGWFCCKDCHDTYHQR